MSDGTTDDQAVSQNPSAPPSEEPHQSSIRLVSGPATTSDPLRSQGQVPSSNSATVLDSGRISSAVVVEKNPFSVMSQEELSTITRALSSEEGQLILEVLSPKPEEWTENADEPVMGYQDEAVDGAVVAEAGDFELPDSMTTSDLMFPGSLASTLDITSTFSEHAYCTIQRSGERVSPAEEQEAEAESNNGDAADSQIGERSEEEESAAARRRQSVRRSTRIQDLSQREQAEKIRAENLREEKAALRALRGETEEPEKATGKRGVTKQYNMRRDRPRRDDGRVDYSRRRAGQGKFKGVAEDEADPGSSDSNTDGEAEHSETSSVASSRRGGYKPQGRGGTKSYSVPGHQEFSDASATSDEEDKREAGKKPFATSRGGAPRARCSRGRGARTIRGGRVRITKVKPALSSQESSDNGSDGDDNDSAEAQFKNSSKSKPGKGKMSGRKTQGTRGKRRKGAGKEKRGRSAEEWGRDKSEDEKGEEDAEKKGILEESDDSDDDIPLGILIPGRKKPEDGELGKGKRKKKATWKLQDPNWESRLPEVPKRTPEKKKQVEKQEDPSFELPSDFDEAVPSDDSRDSDFAEENDPDRLWCICQKPYNNRFMICCDFCEEWFHGSCVDITRKMGKEIARKKEKWACPKCTKETAKKSRGSKKPAEKLLEPKQCSSDTERDSLQFDLDKSVKVKERDEEFRETSPGKVSESPVKAARKSKVKATTTKAGSEPEVKPKVKAIKTTKVLKEVKKEPEQEESVEEQAEEDVKTQDKDTGTKAEVKREFGTSEQKVKKEPATATQQYKIKIEELQKQLQQLRQKQEESSSDDSEMETGNESAQFEETSQPEEAEAAKLQSTKKSGGRPCIVSSCPRNAHGDSVYCSSRCITKHAAASVKLLQQERAKSYGARTKTEGSATERVVVFERKSSKLVTGPAAPTEVTLEEWLLKHPTFEVVLPGSSKASSASKREAKEKQQAKERKEKERREKERKEKERSERREREKKEQERKEQEKKAKERKEREAKEKERKEEKSAAAKKAKTEKSGPVSIETSATSQAAGVGAGPDPARLSVRKSLKDVLTLRANDSEDILLSSGEIKRLALDLEEELFRFYGRVSSKYKQKYRSIVFNVKDVRNKGLFRKILHGEIRPFKLVRMTAEQIASPEVAAWKEDPKDTLNLLDSPEKPEATAPSKTSEKSAVAEKSRAVSSSYDGSADLLSSLIVDTTAQHKTHLFDVNCMICTGKVSETSLDTASKPASKAVASSAAKPKEAAAATTAAATTAPTPPATADYKIPRLPKAASLGHSGQNQSPGHVHGHGQGQKRALSQDEDLYPLPSSSSSSYASWPHQPKGSHPRPSNSNSAQDKPAYGSLPKPAYSWSESESFSSEGYPGWRRTDPGKISWEAPHAKPQLPQHILTRPLLARDPRRHDAESRHPEGDPRRHDGDPRKLEGDPRRLEGDPRRLEGDPRRLEGDPRRLEGDPRRQRDSASGRPITSSDMQVPSVSAANAVSPDVHPLSNQDLQKASGAPTGALSAETCIWKGTMFVQDMVQFGVLAYRVSGCVETLGEDLWTSLIVTGRLPLQQIWEYLERIKHSQNQNRDISVIRLQPAKSEKMPYEQLFTYLNSRGRSGVVGNPGRNIKDLYLVPLASSAQVPSVLMPFHGPGLDVNRPNLLLGVVIKVKDVAPTTASGVVSTASVSKAWMYSERVEDEQKATANAAIAEDQAESKVGDIKEESDGSDLEISEEHAKDPIVKQYARANPKKLAVDTKIIEEDEPYDPLEFDDDDEPQVVESKATANAEKMAGKAAAGTLTTAPQPGLTTPSLSTATSIAIASGTAGSTASVLPASLTQTTSASPLPSCPQPALQLPLSMPGLAQKTGNATEMAAAMLATLAATTTNRNLSQQRQLLMQLTEKVEEQKRILEKQKQETMAKSGAATADESELKTAAIPVSLLAKDSTAYQQIDVSRAEPLRTEQMPEEENRVAGTGSISALPEDHIPQINWARKRLEKKIGSAGAKDSETAPTGNLPEESFRETEKKPEEGKTALSATQPATATSAVVSGLAHLPPSIQNILSGQSWDNLKSALASVTSTTPPKASTTTVSATAQESPTAGFGPDVMKMTGHGKGVCDELEVARNNPGGVEHVIKWHTDKARQEEKKAEDQDVYDELEAALADSDSTQKVKKERGEQSLKALVSHSEQLMAAEQEQRRRRKGVAALLEKLQQEDKDKKGGKDEEEMKPVMRKRMEEGAWREETQERKPAQINPEHGKGEIKQKEGAVGEKSEKEDGELNDNDHEENLAKRTEKGHHVREEGKLRKDGDGSENTTRKDRYGRDRRRSRDRSHERSRDRSRSRDRRDRRSRRRSSHSPDRRRGRDRSRDRRSRRSPVRSRHSPPRRRDRGSYSRPYRGRDRDSDSPDRKRRRSHSRSESPGGKRDEKSSMSSRSRTTGESSPKEGPKAVEEKASTDISATVTPGGTLRHGDIDHRRFTSANWKPEGQPHDEDGNQQSPSEISEVTIIPDEPETEDGSLPNIPGFGKTGGGSQYNWMSQQPMSTKPNISSHLGSSGSAPSLLTMITKPTPGFSTNSDVEQKQAALQTGAQNTLTPEAFENLKKAVGQWISKNKDEASPGIPAQSQSLFEQHKHTDSGLVKQDPDYQATWQATAAAAREAAGKEATSPAFPPGLKEKETQESEEMGMPLHMGPGQLLQSGGRVAGPLGPRFGSGMVASKHNQLGPRCGPGQFASGSMDHRLGVRLGGPRQLGPIDGPVPLPPRNGRMGPMDGSAPVGLREVPGPLDPRHGPRPMGPRDGPGPIGLRDGPGPMGSAADRLGPMGIRDRPGPMGHGDGQNRRAPGSMDFYEEDSNMDSREGFHGEIRELEPRPHGDEQRKTLLPTPSMAPVPLDTTHSERANWQHKPGILGTPPRVGDRDAKSSIPLRGSMPDRGRDMPDHRQDIPDHRRDMPDHRRDVPDHRRDMPDNRRDLPDHRRDIPDHRRDMPDHRRDLPDHRRDLPERKRDIPERKRDMPDHRRDVPERRRDMPERRRDIPEHRRDLPDNKKAASNRRRDVPDDVRGPSERKYSSEQRRMSRDRVESRDSKSEVRGDSTRSKTADPDHRKNKISEQTTDPAHSDKKRDVKSDGRHEGPMPRRQEVTSTTSEQDAHNVMITKSATENLKCKDDDSAVLDEKKWKVVDDWGSEEKTDALQKLARGPGMPGVETTSTPPPSGQAVESAALHAQMPPDDNSKEQEKTESDSRKRDNNNKPQDQMKRANEVKERTRRSRSPPRVELPGRSRSSRYRSRSPHKRSRSSSRNRSRSPDRTRSRSPFRGHSRRGRDHSHERERYASRRASHSRQGESPVEDREARARDQSHRRGLLPTPAGIPDSRDNRESRSDRFAMEATRNPNEEEGRFVPKRPRLEEDRFPENEDFSRHRSDGRSGRPLRHDESHLVDDRHRGPTLGLLGEAPPGFLGDTPPGFKNRSRDGRISPDGEDSIQHSTPDIWPPHQESEYEEDNQHYEEHHVAGRPPRLGRPPRVEERLSRPERPPRCDEQRLSIFDRPPRPDDRMSRFDRPHEENAPFFDRPPRNDEGRPPLFERPPLPEDRRRPDFDRPPRGEDGRPPNFDRPPRPEDGRPPNFDRPPRLEDGRPPNFDRPPRLEDGRPPNFDMLPRLEDGRPLNFDRPPRPDDRRRPPVYDGPPPPEGEGRYGPPRDGRALQFIGQNQGPRGPPRNPMDRPLHGMGPPDFRGPRGLPPRGPPFEGPRPPRGPPLGPRGPRPGGPPFMPRGPRPMDI